MHIFCLSLLFDDTQAVCLASRLHSEQIYALTGRKQSANHLCKGAS